MKQALSKFLNHHFHNPNYAYFLISLSFVIVLPPIATLLSGGRLVLELSYAFVLSMASIYTSKSYRDLIVMSSIGFLILLLFHLDRQDSYLQLFTPILTLTFFTFVFIRLIQYVFQPRAISANDVFALASGYLILGIVAAPFFSLISYQFPNALTISPGSDFYEYIYFSFITLSSVGFGDIAPVHPIAKSFTLILGIAGQLYLSVLVGIIIGKYLTD